MSVKAALEGLQDDGHAEQRGEGDKGGTDAPYARGPLVITALGQRRVICEVIRGADKWVIRA